MMAAGHDLTLSAHYDDIQNMTVDQLVYVAATGSIARRIGCAALLIGAVLTMAAAKNEGQPLSALRNNRALACFVGFAFLSMLWSSEPDLTLRKSAEYFILCVGAAEAGRILRLRGVVWLAFLGSTGYLLIGLIAEVLLGTFHPFSFDYRFCGTLNPNHQAWNCILLLLSGSALLRQIRSSWRIAYFMAMTLGVACLLLAKSRTSLVCGALALMFYWVGRLSLTQKLALAFIIGTLLGSVLFSATLVSSGGTSNFSRMLLAGRDVDSYQNLSERVPLWKATIEYVGESPLAGYGFNSFWTSNHIRDVSAEAGTTVVHSHNEFIELMLSLGAVGLTLYLFQLADTWRILLRSYKVTRNPFVRFYLALLIFNFACMFTEAIAFDVGLPTFCLLSMLWSRKQFAPNSIARVIPALESVQAYQ